MENIILGCLDGNLTPRQKSAYYNHGISGSSLQQGGEKMATVNHFTFPGRRKMKIRKTVVSTKYFKLKIIKNDLLLNRGN
jgi:hypothetical protein